MKRMVWSLRSGVFAEYSESVKKSAGHDGVEKWEQEDCRRGSARKSGGRAP